MTIKEYITKMKGGAKSPPGVAGHDVLWSWLGAVIGIGICGYLSSRYFEPNDLSLLFGAIKSPLAQPRNLIGGHVVSALVGISCYQLLGHTIWLASAMAVSLAIVTMLVTRTLHPPGGATALIAVIGGTKVHDLGFFYALVPAGTGAVVLLVVALFVNNLSSGRRYPEYWM